MIENPIETAMRKSLTKNLSDSIKRISKTSQADKMAKAIVAAGNGSKAPVQRKAQKIPEPAQKRQVTKADIREAWDHPSDNPVQLTKEERKKARHKKMLASRARKKNQKRRKRR